MLLALILLYDMLLVFIILLNKLLNEEMTELVVSCTNARLEL